MISKINFMILIFISILSIKKYYFYVKKINIDRVDRYTHEFNFLAILEILINISNSNRNTKSKR